MSATRSTDSAARRPRADLVLVCAVALGLVAAMLPVTRVVQLGPWLWGSLLLAGAVLATGYALRRTRLPALAVSGVELAVVILVLTVTFLRDSALLGVIPVPATVEEAVNLTGTAFEEIFYSAAPMVASPALSFVIVGAAGLFTVAIDHIALTARMPLLAGIALFTVSLIPALTVPSAVDLWSFALLAAAMLLLLRADTRAREPRGPSTPGNAAVALAVGAAAVVIAVVVTPALPQPLPRVVTGSGASGIDATLSLGEDLRRPDQVEVLRMRTDAPLPPYLRVATLSEFTGGVWQPDRTWSLPLASDAALGEVQAATGVEVVDYATTIDIVSLSSPWLPVPFPATRIEGLEGEWNAMPLNRTVVGGNGATQGQSYVVRTSVPEPTLEQIRAADADPSRVRDAASQLPADLPSVIAESAAAVTAGAASDYDALVALQSWFRGPLFRYSLDAPVEEGFDGSGADAVAAFLEQKEGYCVHYASAFALMARTLGMPARIVVGYLPGVNTSTLEEGQTVRSVLSGQLHSWPEVFFEGIGWVPFEPTNSLGTATNFGADRPDPAATSATPTPTASAGTTPSPTPTASSRPEDLDAQDAATTLPVQRNATTTAWVLLVALAVGLLAAPAAVGASRRRRMRDAAGSGDAGAAWDLVRTTAMDVGIRSVPGDTARTLADRLATDHGADPASLALLVDAIEHASYAAPGESGGIPGPALTAAASAVRLQLLSAAPPSRRVLAALAPRSLIVRLAELPREARQSSGRAAG